MRKLIAGGLTALMGVAVLASTAAVAAYRGEWARFIALEVKVHVENLTRRITAGLVWHPGLRELRPIKLLTWNENQRHLENPITGILGNNCYVGKTCNAGLRIGARKETTAPRLAAADIPSCA